MSDSFDAIAYSHLCDATHPSDECPICGTDCRCAGPHETKAVDACIEAAKPYTPWILTSGSSCIAHSMHPFVHTSHGPEARFLARKFASREAALAFKAEHNISSAFYPEVYSYADRTAPDACPLCGPSCECAGPSVGTAVEDVFAATRASLTPALGRDAGGERAVCEVKPTRRIPADPRLLEGAEEIAATVLAVLKSHGLTIVGPSDVTHESFAAEVGRNAMAVLAMMEVGK